METKILPGFTEDGTVDIASARAAADILRRGGIAAVATETVYGLCADACDEKAVESVYGAKGRPSDNPLIVHISDKNDIYKICRDIPAAAEKLMEVFWPGPLTVVLKSSGLVCAKVSAGLDTVAVRFPSHPVFRKVSELSGVFIAAPSANSSGRPSPTRALHVYDDLNGKIPLIIDGGECEVGLESTVVSVKESGVSILRPGLITKTMLERVCGTVSEAFRGHVEGTPPAPGMKYRHYAPACPVYVFDGPDSADDMERAVSGEKKPAVICFNEVSQRFFCPFVAYGSKDDYEALSRGLFYALRRAETFEPSAVFVQCPPASPETEALRNRLYKAAGSDPARS